MIFILIRTLVTFEEYFILDNSIDTKQQAKIFTHYRVSMIENSNGSIHHVRWPTGFL